MNNNSHSAWQPRGMHSSSIISSLIINLDCATTHSKYTWAPSSKIQPHNKFRLGATIINKLLTGYNTWT